MDTRILNRITLYVAVFGALLAGGTFLVAGVSPGVGAIVGATVALLNWMALRWVISRVQGATNQSQAGLMILLVLKMAALIAVSWALIARWDVNAMGFAVGTGSLVVGILLGSTGGGATQVTGNVAKEEG